MLICKTCGKNSDEVYFWKCDICGERYCEECEKEDDRFFDQCVCKKCLVIGENELNSILAYEKNIRTFTILITREYKNWQDKVTKKKEREKIHNEIPKETS